MSETRFTPGPWRFLEGKDYDEGANVGRPLTVCGGNNDDLANVYSADDSTVSVSRAEAVANAHLIAAAPDLYEALELLLATPEIADADPRDKDEETQIAERKARAALRKARGGVR